ncbi:succinate dehydrogenase, cytochrome b556 subunit [Haloarcula sp. CBA1130]|jgi:succinate dehydrogenase / fumarate reductase cytochrome b subunit|uniref:Succinate dehydrogenase subunit C n=5 Tax=Haloarcula TaxID=2237 RepID=Q5V349_HALMA|nr:MULTISPECIES: succinate dehydrogenase, cytochrome b556 subunit [Haloarcula]AAV46053.1 succinate dehydrogenase subunit C [Haloarcula marismortui ATCC 43049]EMA12474.1 succinate dehydrogenase, cytochrome b556 subunit [Haloarcula californiae ATCC 33799]EMA13934.1 succinate dehydrogenase, cytochrome b556 subunit [Haloarcula sinaiiensis ATCC 33800]EMA30539.1 succinate dehydrogenase, cytochrome b556 subunit [Haloarcula japonica DSM 6131]KAA9397885.1 succinate dehydrogenase, cytochrome b556 subuni
MSQSYNRGTVEDFGRWREFTAGMWAWIFHKFTGWVLVGYLFTHIAVLSTSVGVDPASAQAGSDLYTSTLSGLESLLIVRFLEVGLLAVAVFHILNGIRLLMVDLGVGLESQDKSFYASLLLTGAIVIASVPTFLGGKLA